MLREQENDALQSTRSTMGMCSGQLGLDSSVGSSSRFRDCFWGEQAQGYEVLSEKMKTGLSICKQLIVFFESFAKLEEEHGKALVKLTQASHKGVSRDAELQTLHNCLTHMNDCRYEQLGKTHQLLASRISEELVALKTFRAEQKVIKKREDEAMHRAVKLLDKEAHNVDKTNAHYNTRHRNVVQLQEMIQKTPAENVSKKETLKLQEKLVKAKKEAEQASADYKLAVIRWTEARHAWEERMLAACDVIQAIEQQRIAFIKTRLGRLIT
jgi:nostrin